MNKNQDSDVRSGFEPDFSLQTLWDLGKIILPAEC